MPVRLDEDLLAEPADQPHPSRTSSTWHRVSADVAFGGSQRGNEILLDGVSTTDPLFQDPVLRANYNWVQEVNVVALGAAAEYGGFTGAAGYAVLRSVRIGTPASASSGQPVRAGCRTTRRSCQRHCSASSTRAQLLDWLRPQWAGRRSDPAGSPVVLRRSSEDAPQRPAGRLSTGPGSRDERDLQVLFRPTASLSPSMRVDGFVEHGRHGSTPTT